MTGEDLQAPVREKCRALGLIHFHVRDSRGMNKGLPDDIIIGPRGLLWRERKGPREDVTREQKLTGYTLRALGQDWAVWRPADLASGRIDRELEEIA